MRSSSAARRDPPSTARGPAFVRHVRRLVLGVVGGTVLAIGVAMIVLPGPAFVVIPLGLGILAAEFAWARAVTRRLHEHGKRLLPERWHHVLDRLRRE
jgi:tellurite resistance protein TerC